MSKRRSRPLSRRKPDDIVAHARGKQVRVDELLGRASALAATLPDRPYVINLCSNRYEFLLGFCAAVMAGQCTLMPPNRQAATLQRVADGYAGCYVLGAGAVEELETIPIGALPEALRASAPLVPDDQLCAIVFTSGSTGESLPNHKFWRTLRVGADGSARLLRPYLARPLNVLATVPPQHMWGFETSILLPLFAGVAVSELTPLFPQDIFDALAALPRPRALISSPVHLSAFLDGEVGEIAIDYVFTATAPMPLVTAERLESRHGALVIDIFGSSESGIMAARRQTLDETWTLADAFELRVEGSKTWLSAEHLGDRVLLNDRVETLGNGRFRLFGRDQDMLNIAGKRGSLADLNQRLGTIPGVEDGVIFQPGADAKRLAALVVAPSLKASDILNALRDGVDPAFLPRPVYLVPALPRQETGKLPRRAVLDLFAAIRQQRRAT